MGYILAGNKQWEQGVSALDAALETDALFVPQVTGTILPDGTQDDKSFTIYREMSDGAQFVLNAGVKAGYHSGSYKYLLDTAEAMFPNSVVSMRTWDNGKILVFVQEIGLGHTFADGDELTTHVMYTASLDSTFATAAHGFNFRPFCTNQLALSTLQMAQKRTKNHNQLLFNKAQIMANAHGVMQQFVADAQVLKGLPLTPSLKKRILDTVAPLITDTDAAPKAINHAERRRAGILYFLEPEVEQFGLNAYSLYQAVNTYEFHEGTKGKQQELKQAKQVATQNATMSQQAGRLLLAAAR